MKIFILAVAASTVLSGCSLTNDVNQLEFANLGLKSPVDVQTIRKSHYYSVIGDYTRRYPVEPKPWRELNDRNAANPGGGA